jgi:hypothetical protein
MTRNRLLNMSEHWFRLLQRLYPPDSYFYRRAA